MNSKNLSHNFSTKQKYKTKIQKILIHFRVFKKGSVRRRNGACDTVLIEKK